MREKGLVSIIVPVYNLAEYVGETIESLLRQDYKNLEVIVVNDGSTDETGNIIKHISASDPRLRLITQSNGGAGKARNTGLKIARGEYITFVDGDDTLREGTISSNVEYLNADNNADWVAFSIIRVDNKQRRIYNNNLYKSFEIGKTRELGESEIVDMLREKRLSGVCCGAIYRASSIDGIAFPEDEYYEDSFFFSDLIVNTKKAILSAHGAYLYVHRNGSSQLSALNEKRLTSKYHYLQKLLSNLRRRFPKHEDYYRTLENDFYYFIKTEKSKKTEGAENIFKNLKKQIKGNITIQLGKEIKCLIYTIVGYKNIVRILNNLKS